MDSRGAPSTFPHSIKLIDSTTQLIEVGYEPRPKDWRRVLLADPCAYCGQPSCEVDHITSQWTRGAASDHTNLTGSCRLCNRRKRSRTLLDYLSGLPIGTNPEYGSATRRYRHRAPRV